MPAGVQLGDDGVDRPVAELVDDVAPVAVGQQLGIPARVLAATGRGCGPTPWSTGPSGSVPRLTSPFPGVSTRPNGILYPVTALDAALLTPMLLPSWMDPEFLINFFGPYALWGVAFVIFAECGLFAILPGDSLLFTVGLFTSHRASSTTACSSSAWC